MLRPLLFALLLQPAVARFNPTASQAEHELTRRIVESLALEDLNEKERALALYTWITHNINYDAELLCTGEINQENQSVTQVLRTGKAVCSGYSILFQALAIQADLESSMVEGHAKAARTPGYSVQSAYEPNHNWNMVKWDDTWHMVETTWGSGQLSECTFEKKPDLFWFDPPLGQTVFSHYTEDYELPAAFLESFPEGTWSWEVFSSLPMCAPLCSRGYPAEYILEALQKRPEARSFFNLPNTISLVAGGIHPDQLNTFILHSDTLDAVKIFTFECEDCAIQTLPLERNLAPGKSYTWEITGAPDTEFFLVGPERLLVEFVPNEGLYRCEYTPQVSGIYKIARQLSPGYFTTLLEYTVPQ